MPSCHRVRMLLSSIDNARDFSGLENIKSYKRSIHHPRHTFSWLETIFSLLSLRPGNISLVAKSSVSPIVRVMLCIISFCRAILSLIHRKYKIKLYINEAYLLSRIFCLDSPLKEFLLIPNLIASKSLFDVD